MKGVVKLKLWSYNQVMESLKATVKNGRLLLDEPTDRPDGEVVELVEADPFSTLTPEERATLNASIDRGMAQAATNQTRPLDDIIDAL